jgi:hypothetical protein
LEGTENGRKEVMQVATTETLIATHPDFGRLGILSDSSTDPGPDPDA